MGHKVHPIGFRIGIIRDWQAKWYASKHYVEFLQEDLKLREAIRSRYTEAGISQVQIDRQTSEVSVTIYTARPGIVIGRGGQRVDEMRLYLGKLIGKRVQLTIQEIQQPELDAYLVARTVAEQIKRRVAYRRAMKQAIFRTMQAGAKGIRISCAGRLGGAEIARRQTMHQGRVPLHTLRADIDYGFVEAHTTLGRIGIKVWVYKGDILPELKLEEAAEPVAEVSVEVAPVAEVEAKPAEPVAEVSVEVAPSAEVEAKPAEPVARRGKEKAPVAEVEAKPAKPVARRGKEKASVAEVEAEPAKPVARRGKEKAPVAEVEAKPAEPVAEVSVEVAPVAEVEAKPAKSVARRSKEKAPVAEVEAKDVTTQAG